MTAPTMDSRDVGPALMPLMTTTERADPSDVRMSNRLAVFSLLFPSHSLSRAQIGRMTGLSRVSVSQVVSDLIDHRILRESGRQESAARRGKRGTLVSVDDSHWSIVAIDLSQPYRMRGAVLNLIGIALASTELAVDDPGQTDPERIAGMVSRLLAQAPGEVLGIGIAVTGIVDGHGTVIDSRNLGWAGVALGPALEERFGLPVTVSNDANSALLTERFYGGGTPNTLFVQMSMGVGAALLLGDSVVLGPTHAAGEIGHVVVDPAGEECVCGKRGCLEAMINVPRLSAIIASDPSQRAQVLAEAGRLLGGALAMPASLLDLADIVVHGPAEIVGDSFLGSAEAELNARMGSALRRHIPVRRCNCGDGNVLRGEGIAVLQAALGKL